MRIVGLAAFALLAFSCSAAQQGLAAAKNLYGEPARLVRLPDGRALNLVCTGRGSPTVLFESGFGAGAAAWGEVQPAMAQRTRTCSYDRAGYGFSDPGPLPRDGEAIARDLDAALRKAGERGPFVIVGHSAGGLYGLLFAARRRPDVVGLVLVDSSVPYQDRRLAALFGAGVGSLDGIRHRPLVCLDAAKKGSMAALDAEGCLPKTGDAARRAASRVGTWADQLSELDTLFNGTSAEVIRIGGILRQMPAIVLTASPTGTPAGREDQGAAAWQTLHREIANAFVGGQQRIVKSSHLMMIDRPEVVTAAALELVNAYRTKPRRP